MDESQAVHFREITEANRAAVEALVVAPDQERYVRDVAGSLVEATEYGDARPRFWALYDVDTPVGFVMISDGITPADMQRKGYLGPYYLWRLLIDRDHQRRGYGTAAIRLVVAHLRASRPDAHTLITSCQPGPLTPVPFYLGLGFQDTGEIHDGEAVLTLGINAGR
jgi:diamine N-acetyltransferase